MQHHPFFKSKYHQIMKLISFTGWFVYEMIGLLFLLIATVTVVAAWYLLVEVVIYINNSFKHDEAHQQPGNAVGLHIDEYKDFDLTEMMSTGSMINRFHV